MSAAPAAAPAVRTRRRQVVGRVVSDRMQKTIRVSAFREFKHPKYEKRMRRDSVYVAHDEHNDARVGDAVEIVETRPLSKTKRWRLLKVVTRAE